VPPDRKSAPLAGSGLELDVPWAFVQGSRFGVQGSRFPHLTPVPPASAASVFAAHPGGRAPEPPPCPRPVQWFWGLCRNTDWPAESSRRPAAAVRNFSRAPDSTAFRAAPGSVSGALSA